MSACFSSNELKLGCMKNTVFYLGLGLLFTHEMDAMQNHEWRVLPLIRSMAENTGEFVFLVAHVPIFALTIMFAASLNQKTRLLTQKVACTFLIIHAVLHFAFSAHSNYEFSSGLSNYLIYGAALCGFAYFVRTVVEPGGDAA